jgi:8-oxo-dGTP diphosphatase
VHWDNPLPVTATIISKNNKIVLVKRKYPPFVGDWCLPGGFIEAQESPIESAIREVEEETGLKIEIDRLVDAFAPGKGINVVILFYLARPAQGDLMAGDDASEVACFSQTDLPKNIAFPLHKQMIDKWFAGKL